MSKVTTGIKPWGASQDSKRKNFGDDEIPRLKFVKLNEGLNDVRFVSGIGNYYQARVKLPGSRNKKVGDRERSSYPTYDNCPLVNDLNQKVKERYMAIVINRNNGNLEILDFNFSVKRGVEDAIKAKNSRRKGGDEVTPLDFDVAVKFNPQADTPNDWYNATAHDTDPLSEEDIALIEAVGGFEVIEKILNRQLICPKRETVVKRLVAKGWDEKPVVQEEQAEASSTEGKLEKPEEDDYSFQRPAEDKEMLETALSGR